ncbi:MAG: HlyD family efflux transporter periplasmic adaptor subunit, partial [bacterium]|nr:HlyD family efflux transporter periplasmic adaptor subunit [bacterium]
MKKNNKIVKYPTTLNINIGVVIFAIIFIYFLFNIYTYVNAKHVTYYEVDEGSIRVRTSYSGLALRQEQLVYAPKDGYINYYLKDNSRAKNGSLICSIDENGDISGQIRRAGASDMR